MSTHTKYTTTTQHLHNRTQVSPHSSVLTTTNGTVDTFRRVLKSSFADKVCLSIQSSHRILFIPQLTFHYPGDNTQTTRL